MVSYSVLDTFFKKIALKNLGRAKLHQVSTIWIEGLPILCYLLQKPIFARKRNGTTGKMYNGKMWQNVKFFAQVVFKYCTFADPALKGPKTITLQFTNCRKQKGRSGNPDRLFGRSSKYCLEWKDKFVTPMDLRGVTNGKSAVRMAPTIHTTKRYLWMYLKTLW